MMNCTSSMQRLASVWWLCAPLHCACSSKADSGFDFALYDFHYVSYFSQYGSCDGKDLLYEINEALSDSNYLLPEIIYAFLETDYTILEMNYALLDVNYALFEMNYLFLEMNYSLFETNYVFFFFDELLFVV